jgi:mRNA interferase RelE/StbE
MPLLFAPDALESIPHNEKERLKRKIDWLWVNRLVITHQPLHWDLSGFFKRRVGNYRVIYTYDNSSDDMVIHLVGLRDSIYQEIRH